MGGAHFSLDERSGQDLGAPPAAPVDTPRNDARDDGRAFGSADQEREAGQVAETGAPHNSNSASIRREGAVEMEGEEAGDSEVARATEMVSQVDDDYVECVFGELRLE